MSKPHQDKPILRLDHVNFSYYSNLGEVKVLNDINFTVEKVPLRHWLVQRLRQIDNPLLDCRTAQTRKRLHHLLL